VAAVFPWQADAPGVKPSLRQNGTSRPWLTGGWIGTTWMEQDLPYVLMIFLPAGRSLTGPFPPGLLAARVLAAVIRPPRLFFAI